MYLSKPIDKIRKEITHDDAMVDSHELDFLNDPISVLTPLWRDLQILRDEINDEKKAAVASITARYKDRLAKLEGQYAMMLKLTRG